MPKLLFTEIINAAHRGISASAERGVVATEIFLGPEEIDTIRDGIYRMTKAGLTRPLKGKGANSIFGLRIVEMKEPGIRVGHTIEMKR